MMKTPILLTALLLIASGCKSYTYEKVETPIKESVYAFPATATASGALAAEEAQGIDAMLAAIPPASVRMAIIKPGRYYESGKLEALQYHLMQRGFDPKDIRVFGSAADPAMTLKIRYRVFPEIADCGKWYAGGTYNEINAMDSQLGCASANNLRQMVAVPSDLMEPRTDSRAETDSTVRAIGIHNGTVKQEITAQDILEAAYKARTTEE